VRIVSATVDTDGGDDTCGTLNNTATVAATNEAEAATQNNTAGDSIEVDCPDVRVEKTTPNTTPVTNGAQVSYTITVTANGDGDATNVTLTDTVPGGVAAPGWAITGPDAADCNPNPVAGGALLTCNFGTLGGENLTASITLTATVASCSPLSNTASVTAAVDTNEGNNSAGPVTIEVQCPDIRVDKTGSALINPGDPVSYTITVVNDGPGVANSVTLSDTMPTGAPSWTISGPDAVDCAPNPVAGGAVLTCNFGNLAEGGMASITLSGTTPDNGVCGPLTNTAVVDATNEPDTAEFTGNNTDTATIPCVLATGNLVVRKYIDFDGGRDIDAGDTLDNGWAITITCEGEAPQVINTGANGQGTITILGLDEGTDCTVSENPNSKAGFQPTGFDSNDAGGPGTGAGTSTTVTIDETTIAEVTFFNQPFTEIVVRKQTLRNGNNEPSQNGGWHITIKGCGIQQTKDTVQGNPFGQVTFSDLPACPGGYEVSEDENSKPSANPAFNPDGPTERTVHPDAGESETVTFTNVREDEVPNTPTPTATPTNTPTPTATPTNTPTNTPTATPTNTPTNTPTPIDTVEGVRTPAPPETGSGFTSMNGSGANLLMAVFGLVAMGGGFFILAAFRKQRDER
jgi:uncharacterized repeat protein (TIGR01451 family)